jgi:hypothetical protein
MTALLTAEQSEVGVDPLSRNADWDSQASSGWPEEGDSRVPSCCRSVLGLAARPPAPPLVESRSTIGWPEPGPALLVLRSAATPHQRTSG